MALFIPVFLFLTGCDNESGTGGGGDGGSELSSEKDITAFSITDPSVTGTVNEDTITLTVPFGTDPTNLIAVFTTTGESVYVDTVLQTSGSSSNNFTNPVTYTVNAEDSSSKDYTVTVTISPLAIVSTTEIAGNLTFTVALSGTSATGGGDVTSEGNSSVTEKGICWSTSTAPTTADSTSASSSSGSGAFTDATMTGLTENTTYYVRAYAINSDGTAYGNEVSFNSGWAFSATERYGGLVFYNDGNGGGMVAAPADTYDSGSYSHAWGPDVDENGDDSTAVPELAGIGDGTLNSQYIYDTYGPDGTDTLSSYPIFDLCSQYDYGSYTDWFIPSTGELALMYQNLYENGYGGFSAPNYWSSTEYNTAGANFFSFATGVIDYDMYKGDGVRSRFVREF